MISDGGQKARLNSVPLPSFDEAESLRGSDHRRAGDQKRFGHVQTKRHAQNWNLGLPSLEQTESQAFLNATSESRGVLLMGRRALTPSRETSRIACFLSRITFTSMPGSSRLSFLITLSLRPKMLTSHPCFDRP